MIVGEVILNNKEITRLASGGDKLQKVLKTEIQALAIELQNKVKSEKLNGAVLHRRTGNLMRSIHQRVEEEPNAIYGFVGTNVNYGIAHEFGVHKAVTVPAHVRTITQVFGNPIEPMLVQVRSYTMNMNLPERSFLRSSLKEFRNTAKDRIIAVVKGAI